MRRTVIVTGVGGEGQLGYALAAACVRAGWAVVVTGRSPELPALAARLAGADQAVSAVSADLLVDGEPERVVAAALARHGRLDALVNAAGGLSVTGPVEQTTIEALRRELDRNLATAVAMSRAALPALRASAGAIVNFASPAASRPLAGLAAYSAAKAGVVAFTAALALEEKAAGVRVNAIAPGTMDTAQNLAEGGGQGAYVRRAAVADVVLFLVSPAARAITGETIRLLRASDD